MANKKIKVLHVGCSYLPYLGGGTQRLLEISRGLCNQESLVLSLITHTSSGKNGNSVAVEGDGIFHTIYRVASINSLKGTFDFYTVLRKELPEVVVLHNSRVALIYYALARPLLKKKPKTIIEIHSVRENGSIQKALNRWLYSKVERVVVLADASKKFMLSNYDLDESKVVVVRNGYSKKDSNGHFLRRNYDSDRVTYAYIGSFHEWQGVIDLCKAVVNIEEGFWLRNSIYFVGDGPCVEECKEIIRGAGYENLNIHFTGWMPKDEVARVLSETDFLIAPRPSTVATETVVPLKVTESIESGIPLICSDVGGLTELLYDSQLALFFKAGDVKELSRILRYPPDGEKYASLVKRINDARERWPSWEDSAKKYLGVFNG